MISPHMCFRYLILIALLCLSKLYASERELWRGSMDLPPTTIVDWRHGYDMAVRLEKTRYELKITIDLNSDALEKAAKDCIITSTATGLISLYYTGNHVTAWTAFKTAFVACAATKSEELKRAAIESLRATGSTKRGEDPAPPRNIIMDPLSIHWRVPVPFVVRTKDQIRLQAGWGLQCGNYTYKFQTDGNFVRYENGSKKTWDSKTFGKDASQLIVQEDGNVVVYKNVGGKLVPVAHTATGGNPGAFLAMQVDGNIVVYKKVPGGDPKAIWDAFNHPEGFFPIP